MKPMQGNLAAMLSPHVISHTSYGLLASAHTSSNWDTLWI